ncbi:hypothetical protein TcasGA2_TC034024 [Tribolium castaneum]|uniref:Uncharacterized protein n=1 Tax=Tribolium castaneum TaxID=7070 RepID=A0A139WDQ4_TRICA|nr:hypothetical protein TcasGA2_TC034024 [Tribolium castaneum]
MCRSKEHNSFFFRSNWQILEKLARKPYQIANNLVHFEARNHLIMKEFVVRSYYK